jgi:hypothetical protein
MNVLLEILSLVAQIAGTTSEAATIQNIIVKLENILPLIGDEISALYNMVKNIITVLMNNGNITAEQMLALQALDAATDAKFEAAAVAAGAAPDPNQPASPPSSPPIPPSA